MSKDKEMFRVFSFMGLVLVSILMMIALAIFMITHLPQVVILLVLIISVYLITKK